MRAHPLSHSALTPFPGIGETKDAAGATAQDLRTSNLATTLRHILTSPGDTSRATIAARTGSTRATISRLVDELISAGLVTENETTSTSNRGRPAIKLSPTPRKIAALGLEISVDTLKAHLIDLNGDTITHTHTSRPVTNNPQDTFQALAHLAHNTLNTVSSLPLTVIGSGLALPGIISNEGLSTAPNLGWRNIPHADIRTYLGHQAPRFIANEADLAAYRVAHPKPGVPSGSSSFIYISGEVGIGAGIILNHRQITGTHGWAGEIGHICINPYGHQCSCGSQGCLETLLGRKALALHSGLPENTTPAQVLAHALSGDPHAQKALDEGARALGRALATVVNIIDIQDIILGGNLADLATALTSPCLEELIRFSPQARLNKPVITTVKNSSNYSVTGAAHRVLEDFVHNVALYI